MSGRQLKLAISVILKIGQNLKMDSESLITIFGKSIVDCTCKCILGFWRIGIKAIMMNKRSLNMNEPTRVIVQMYIMTLTESFWGFEVLGIWLSSNTSIVLELDI